MRSSGLRETTPFSISAKTSSSKSAEIAFDRRRNSSRVSSARTSNVRCPQSSPASMSSLTKKIETPARFSPFEIYYAPGSLKARLCVEGSREVYAYCDEKGIPYERCGKVVGATCEDELPRLEELSRRARANGVPGIQLIDEEKLAELEPHVVGIRALYSPGTGIVDFRRVADALAQDVTSMGGTVRTGAAVVGIRLAGGIVELRTPQGPVQARSVITCAGLYSDRLARLTGGSETPKIVPFRGRDYSPVRTPAPSSEGSSTRCPIPRFRFWVCTSQNRSWVTSGRARTRSLRSPARDTGRVISAPGSCGRRSRIRAFVHSLHGIGGSASRKYAGIFSSAPSRRAAAARADHPFDRPPGGACGCAGAGAFRGWPTHRRFLVRPCREHRPVRNAPSPGATSSLALAREIVRVSEDAISGA